MKALHFRALLLLIGIFPLVGCVEERTEITLQQDGRVLLDYRLELSERFLRTSQALTADPVYAHLSPFKITEPEVRAALEVAGATGIDIDRWEGEGTAGIRVTAELASLAALSRTDLGFQLGWPWASIKENGRARFSSYFGRLDEKPLMTLDEFYALAHGAYIHRIVHFPEPVLNSNGVISEDGKTVTWKFDLRDPAGLEATRKQFGNTNHFEGTVDFPARWGQYILPSGDRGWNAPLASIPDHVNDYKITMPSLTWQDSAPVGRPSTPNPFTLTIDMYLEWPGAPPPAAVRGPYLNFARDSHGTLYTPIDISKLDFEFLKPEDNSKGFTLHLSSRDSKAERLEVMDGMFVVFSDSRTEMITLENFTDLVGAEKTGHPVLDERGIRLSDIDGNKVYFSLENGFDLLSSVTVLKNGSAMEPDFREIMLYESYFLYPSAPGDGDALQIELTIYEGMKIVPFRMHDIPLP